MKRMVLFALAALCAAGCRPTVVMEIGSGEDRLAGSGTAASEERAISDVHALTLSGAYDVTVTGGGEPRLAITADDNIVPLVRTEAKDGVLDVRLDRSVSTRNRIQIGLTTRTVDLVRVSGASQVRLLAVTGSTLRVEVSGASLMQAAGRVDEFAADISGAGNIAAQDLQAGRATVRINGTGNVDLTALEELDARISGVGRIRYFGSPPKVSRHIDGVGTIQAGGTK